MQVCWNLKESIPGVSQPGGEWARDHRIWIPIHFLMIKCIIWNVCGLFDPCRKGSITILCFENKYISVLYLQEVKVVGFKLRTTLNVIWPEGFSFLPSHQEGKGRVATILAPSLKKNIIDWGCEPTNRALWIVYNVRGNTLGIVNICAPNSYAKRIQLWKQLTNKLPIVS